MVPLRQLAVAHAPRAAARTRASTLTREPETLAAVVARLQRDAGNVAVGRMLQRVTGAKPKKKKKGIDYPQAERRNKRYAEKLGWESRLAAFQPTWDEAWSKGEYSAFADLVAAFQRDNGLGVDGELGPATWNRIRPIGEVIAERRVDWKKSLSVCTIATQERLVEGYKAATGTKLVGKDESKTFNAILQSIPSWMDDVDEQYRATGAAGALVYLGAGTFVTQKGIWEDRALLPGAAIQVWGSQSGYERVRKGEGSAYGTSFVFVEYVDDDTMKVLHYDEEETKDKDDYEVWIGANLTSR